MNEEMEKLFNSFVTTEGKIKEYPSKKKRAVRPYLYEYLITKFDNEKEYSEIEVNFVIRKWILFDDFVVVRREMCDLGLLVRTPDGRKYLVNKDYVHHDEPIGQ